MGRSTLTPNELKAKSIFSNNLNAFLRQKGLKKVDVHLATGIAKSTISDYFTGKTLPSEDNLEKLATFFNVDKSEIDPRFKTTSNEETHVTHIDLKTDPVALSYDGQPATQDDMDFIKMILKRRKEKNKH